VAKAGVALNPELAGLGTFKAESVPVSSIGKGQVAAQRILDRVGYR
jgi:iron(III) transport system substrate-binding protein